MKYFSFLLFLVVEAQVARANAIDKLKTDMDVFDLLISVKAFGRSTPIKVMPSDTLLKRLNCNEIALKWKVKSWERVDLNHDKLTDLIVTVKDNNTSLYIFAVIDKGKGGLKCLELSNDRGDYCQLVKPITVNAKQMLAYYSKRYRMVNQKLELNETEQIDTLIYLFDGFVEYNRKPANYGIESIAIKVTDSLRVTNQGTVFYNPGLGRMFHDTVEMNRAIARSHNTYISNIPLIKLNNIKALINYIDIKKKKISYSVLWTDDAEANLIIKFTDGTKKEIRDYGMIGSFGLTRLYLTLLDLKESLNWKLARK
ncbi:hypothetical protein [Mucilaginibacter sp.]|uniref:DUF6438 domain-containing protein n=1 Tax=Mucilaginibacter sp. TaxID=1882438 RepID=UPI002ED4D767